MKTIYLDVDFKCHVADDGTMAAVETDFFDGKCATYVEGYRFVPEGATWTRPDGAVFSGPMLAPWRNHSLLLEFQQQYESKDEDYIKAYQEGVDSV